jgi:hypothetical protein
VSADRAEHPRLEFTEGDFIRPAIGVQFGLMVAAVIAAEDRDVAPTEAAHGP